MIATIAKRFTFDAAHRLDRLPPTHKCHGMHGHTYVVEIIFAGPVDDMGFVIDYADIDGMWQPLHAVLDHKVLNEVPGLAVPSTEHLAGWIFAHLIECKPGQPNPKTPAQAMLNVVRVKESTSTWCAVWRNELVAADLERFLLN
jgi:6-pyruvoyltetrahydropterin/6-carboxytetrahydropterin synthase